MVLGLNYTILHVANLDEALAFYRGKLGLEVEDQNPGFVQFKHSGSGAQFALEKVDNAGAIANVELCWFVANADVTHASLVEQGVPIVEPLKDMPFGRAFTVKDPAGNPLILLQVPGGR